MTNIKRNILIVDDDEPIRDIILENMTYLLRSKKIDNIFHAEDGIQALKMCDRFKITTLITDLKMPNMSGWELVKEFRQKYGEEFPVFIFTAFSTDELKGALESLKAVKVFKKPMDFEALFAEVEKELEKLGK